MWSSRPRRAGSSSFPASSASTSTTRSSARPAISAAQAEQTFVNLEERARRGRRRTSTHVVKLNNYFIDIAHLGVFREVRDRFVDTAAPPASTAVAISALARPGALIEVEAIAVVPDESRFASPQQRDRGAPQQPKGKRLQEARAKASRKRK